MGFESKPRPSDSGADRGKPGGSLGSGRTESGGSGFIPDAVKKLFTSGDSKPDGGPGREMVMGRWTVGQEPGSNPDRQIVAGIFTESPTSREMVMGRWTVGSSSETSGPQQNNDFKGFFGDRSRNPDIIRGGLGVPNSHVRRNGSGRKR